MPLYHIVFLFLLICTIIEFIKGNTPRILFYIAFGVLAAMLCFRYLQGTDYKAYQVIYEATNVDLIKTLTNPNSYGEPGWKFLCWIFRLFSAPFSVFVFVFSALQIYLFWRFVQKFCTRKLLALFLSYHTLYLTFFFSTMRQGFVIAMFLGLLLPLFMEKKYWLYFLISALVSTVHTCGIMLFVLPILNTRLFATTKMQLVLVFAAWIVGVIIASGILDGLLSKVLPASIMKYFSQRGVSLFASMERIGSYCVVVFAYMMAEWKNKPIAPHVRFALKVVSLGMIIYGGFLWLPLVASRLCYLFKVVEIVIFTSLLVDKDLLSRLKLLYCAALVSLMYVKNISAYIDEGEYRENVNVLNFPYISIFDETAPRRYKLKYYKTWVDDAGKTASTPYNVSGDYFSL